MNTRARTLKQSAVAKCPYIYTPWQGPTAIESEGTASRSPGVLNSQSEVCQHGNLCCFGWGTGPGSKTVVTFCRLKALPESASRYCLLSHKQNTPVSLLLRGCTHRAGRTYLQRPFKTRPYPGAATGRMRWLGWCRSEGWGGRKVVLDELVVVGTR